MNSEMPNISYHPSEEARNGCDAILNRIISNLIAIGWLLQVELINPLSSATLSLIIGTGLRAAYLSLSPPSDGVPIVIWQRGRDRSSIGCYESPVIPWSGQ